MYTYIFKRYLNRNQHLSIHVDTYAHTKIFNSIKNVVFNKKCFKSPFLIKTVFCIMFALVVFKYHPAEVSLTGHALGIRICGCSLFYKRELWASKSAGAHSTKSLKISGCKRWYPKDLQVPAPAAPAITHSLPENQAKIIQNTKKVF